MLLRNLVLSVAVMLSLSACSTAPLLTPTVKRQPAPSCLTKCDPLPPLVDGSELSARRWEFEAIETFSRCRRLHADCVAWVSE